MTIHDYIMISFFTAMIFVVNRNITFALFTGGLFYLMVMAHPTIMSWIGALLK